MSIPPLPVLIAQVMRHAREHYETDGWDIIVECFDEAAIAEIIGRCWTTKGAIAKVAAVARLHAERRADVRAEIF
jgi:hypothetical protein